MSDIISTATKSQLPVIPFGRIVKLSGSRFAHLLPSLALEDPTVEVRVNDGAVRPLHFLTLTAAAERMAPRHPMFYEPVAFDAGPAGWVWAMMQLRMSLTVKLLRNNPGITNFDLRDSDVALDPRTRVSELRASGLPIISVGKKGRESVGYHLATEVEIKPEAIIARNPRHIADALPPLDILGKARENYVHTLTARMLAAATEEVDEVRLHSWAKEVPVPKDNASDEGEV
jgi:hypothetical protein